MWQKFFALVLLALPLPAFSQGFSVTVLGARGGLEDGNLSAYLVRPLNEDAGVLCDAGTVLNGLKVSEQKNAFQFLDKSNKKTENDVEYVLHNVIRAYLISHSHLDHVGGLVDISPDDNHKPIFALKSVNDVMSRDLFNGEVWPNMGNRGKNPRIGVYEYHDLKPSIAADIPNTSFHVTAYPLSHGGVESSAFLLESKGSAILYLGDTGADVMEKSHKLLQLWQAVAPYLRARKLKGIIIECSYDNSRPIHLLFGHLKSELLLQELTALRNEAGVSLKGLPVIVSHIKPSLTSAEASETRIMRELSSGNIQHVRFIVPIQGEVIKLY
ncbi:3',5'-cyclic-nucleotide phosphodiesterase [Gluconobacter wancherniae]|uniref:MBL fold metallo-hydrolase n=1 Tax=Gluconobacter wancherniae TaxID=1307955 RepID=UPI001B8B1D7B|nr:3',5'-cyclic-nucleotide phosphodiesterase [Gluconobacter wancherniae]MBS1061433.1 3',5'-cyclic-nucleotide phosphodiesterase [Gluconobacter wancherniae]